MDRERLSENHRAPGKCAVVIKLVRWRETSDGKSVPTSSDTEDKLMKLVSRGIRSTSIRMLVTQKLWLPEGKK